MRMSKSTLVTGQLFNHSFVNCTVLGGCQRDGLLSFHGQKLKELPSLSTMVCSVL